MKLVAASDSSMLVLFADENAPGTQAKVLGLFHALQARHDPRIRNLHPGYVSLLVDFDPLVMTHEEVAVLVDSAADAGFDRPPDAGNIVDIPVCYGGEFGPDLSDVAAHAHLSEDEVVRIHAGGDYQVAFLGFTAGFAYLSGMPEALSMPRLATPRRAVAAGSVGIAGGQTGIYPTETPGGWRLIGRTPLRMFDPKAGQPTRVVPGDRVRFVSINSTEYERLAQERG
ncbi:MAG TPA: 5-oxoprolinase subunit PxpB [Candidatus Methylomirabilis sp.]|nr:5-oxoprolinase subunit PxpB [Candidatus Methylomirabilis sp.]